MPQGPRIRLACVDGEIVALDASGQPSFSLLQHHGSEIKSVLISSALGNDQSNIVVLFTGAKLFKSIDNSRYHHLWR